MAVHEPACGLRQCGLMPRLWQVETRWVAGVRGVPTMWSPCAWDALEIALRMLLPCRLKSVVYAFMYSFEVCMACASAPMRGPPLSAAATAPVQLNDASVILFHGTSCGGAPTVFLFIL